MPHHTRNTRKLSDAARTVYSRHVPVSPEDLERQAAELELMQEKAANQAKLFGRAARELRSAALSERRRRGEVPEFERESVESERKASLAKSAGRSKDDLVVAANGAGLTLTALAARAGVVKTQLSLARRGLRPIRESVAKRIEELTGFKASLRNWPGGILEG